MIVLTSVFGIPVTPDEAQSFWENRKDYEQEYWKTLNGIADEVAGAETHSLDLPLCDVMSERPSDKLKVERAWTIAVWHALFKPYGHDDKFFLDSGRIFNEMFSDKKKRFLWDTYIVRKPNPGEYFKLQGTPFAEQYRNHAAYYTVLTPSENHHPYSVYHLGKE